MGASSWIYYVPYQEDLEQAFQALRQHVFETNDYNHFWRLHGQDEGLVDIDGNELFPSLSPPQTIEEVIQRSQPEGTHSILDVSRLITDSHYFGDVPLPEDVIRGILENERPTKAMVKAIVCEENVWSHLNGWFKAERIHLARGIRGPRIYCFSEELLQFFAREHSKEELVEALLTRDGFWRGIHPCLRSVLEKMALWTRHGTVMPFSEEVLRSFFSHEKPNKADAEAAFAQREIWGHMRVGMGYYAVMYQDGVPQEIVFAGFSGD